MNANEFAEAVATASGWDTSVHREIADNCKAAGLGVMGEILTVIHDRDDEGDLTQVLLRVSADREEISDLYDTYIGPALDRLEQALYDMSEED